MHGDTDIVTHGVGTFGSRGLVVGGTAVVMALGKIVSKAKRIAAHRSRPAKTDIDFRDGLFTQARAASGGSPGPRSRWRRTSGTSRCRARSRASRRWRASSRPGTTFPFGVHFCQVAIDRDTGELTLERFLSVDDVGNVINPLLADGQRLGGIVQGLGQACARRSATTRAGSC